MQALSGACYMVAIWMQTHLVWKAQKTHLGSGYLAVVLPCWSCKVSFFKTWWPIHSFIYYCDLLFLFGCLDNITSMTHSHSHVRDFSLFMVTMFIKLALFAFNFNVIAKRTVDTDPVYVWSCGKAYDMWLKNNKYQHWGLKWF